MTVDAELESAAQRIAERGRQEVVARLRETFIHQAASTEAVQLDPIELEQLVAASAERAGGALWRRSLAAAASDVLGVALPDAVEHPAVLRAHELVAAPPYPADDVATAEASPDAAPAVAALRVPAVHQEGIEALRAGERDLELRLSPDGLDVIKASSGATIGRLRWEEISRIELPRPRRGLRRRDQELRVATGRGRAIFTLPDLTDEQRREHLEPLLAAHGHGPAAGGDEGGAGTGTADPPG